MVLNKEGETSMKLRQREVMEALKANYQPRAPSSDGRPPRAPTRAEGGGATKRPRFDV